MATGTVIGIEEPANVPTDGTGILEGTVISGTESDDSIPRINPADIESTSTGSAPKRRGRPKGSRNASTPKPASQKVQADLTQVLVGIHFGLSKISHIPELVIDKDEAKELSDSLLRVNALYNDIVIPEKVMAWIGLIICVCTVYGTRFMAYKIRTEKESKEKKAPQPLVVLQPHGVS